MRYLCALVLASSIGCASVDELNEYKEQMERMKMDIYDLKSQVDAFQTDKHYLELDIQYLREKTQKLEDELYDRKIGKIPANFKH